MSASARKARRVAPVGLVGLLVLLALVVLSTTVGGLSPVPADAATVTQVITASADTYVNASSPSTALGSQSALAVDASPKRNAFVRFDLSGVTGTITAAVLRLHTQNTTSAASPAGGTVRAITANSWSEAATTSNNQPSTSGTTVGSLGAVAANTWYRVDALSAVTPGSVANFSMESTNTDGAYYDARDAGANGPQLVLPIETQPSTTVTLASTADTYVDGTAATTNYGIATTFSADASPVRQAFVRFNLAAVPVVGSARLRLHVTNTSSGPSPSGGTVSRVAGTWSEATTTYNNRPALGASVGSFGAVTQNSWVELDVTSAVVAGAILELGITSNNTDGVTYDARESGTNAPQLIVSTTPPPPPTGIVVAAEGDIACAPSSAVTSTTCRQLSVSNLIQNDPAVQHFLALGDLQYPNGELANFQTAYEASFGRFKAKTKPAPGNHEYNTANAAGYYAYFGALAGDPTEGYSSFDVGATWHVVALNSNCAIVSCAVGSAQEQWLRADLAASTRSCTIAFWHHPRHASSSRGDNTDVDPLWRAVAERGTEIVLTGHEHYYERFNPMSATGAADANGVRSFIVGTGGNSMSSFSTTRANSVARLRAFGVLKLTLATSSYAWQLINESGTVLDSGTGTCR